MIRHSLRSAAPLSGALGLLLAVLAAPASAQVPEPRIPDTNQRSGLLSRFVPIQPNLPTDPHRDIFYDTRWADSPCIRHPNSPCTSGLYGQRLKADCTACYYPSFRGSPGQNTLRPDCEPHCRAARLVTNFTRPFQPVCHYYAGGCYVPVYDLDPWVTGPGPFPWPFFFKRPTGG